MNALWVFPSIFFPVTMITLWWMGKTEQVHEWVRSNRPNTDVMPVASFFMAILIGVAVSVIVGPFVLCYL